MGDFLSIGANHGIKYICPESFNYVKYIMFNMHTRWKVHRAGEAKNYFYGQRHGVLSGQRKTAVVTHGEDGVDGVELS